MTVIDEKRAVARQQPSSSFGQQSPQPRQDANGGIVTDGFQLPDISVEIDAVPPPYGESLDQMQFSQPGIEAGAVVTSTYLIYPPSCQAVMASCHSS